MNTLDSHRIELPCPHCGHKLSKTIAQLKAQHESVTCGCGMSFHVDKAQFLRDIGKAEKAVADLKRALGRLG